jgi:CheY-like chemotaxis protein
MSNVLFVEDEADLRTLMFEALSDQGYTVTLARNGREALLALGGERLDLRQVEGRAGVFEDGHARY